MRNYVCGRFFATDATDVVVAVVVAVVVVVTLLFVF